MRKDPRRREGPDDHKGVPLLPIDILPALTFLQVASMAALRSARSSSS